MTKREREAVFRKIDRLTARVGKKRDELRKLLDDVTPLIDSIDEADNDLSETLSLLGDARRSFESATDKLSQYV